ncbi:MAG: type II secretion system protein [Butyrivibrio sp.]
MKDQKKNNKGFSLVELIVVVAIMAVLLGVLVPTLVRNVEKSKKQKDINNLSELRSAIQTTMASEEFSGLTGTISFSGKTFDIKNTSTSATLSSDTLFTDEGTTEDAFWKEVLANLNGGADYKFTYSSKLKDGEPEVTFVLQNEKVVGSVKVTAGKYKDENGGVFQLQDAAQSSTVAS